MKKTNENKNVVANILQKGAYVGVKAANVGVKAAKGVKDSVKAMSEKSKNDKYLRKIKKYNPLFPEVYNSENFKLPNMIMIVDDAERRDVDVCEGAIGWLTNDTEMEVLCLYDEAVQMSGITFVPAPMCDAMYYVDSFDRKKFVRVDLLFNQAHEERLAELKHIAHSLGAKKCKIELCEVSAVAKSNKKKVEAGESAGIASMNESTEMSSSYSEKKEARGYYEATFSGSSDPKRPNLKWFKHNDNITKLIEMRCGSGNDINEEKFEILGTTCTTMSMKTAKAIDSTVNQLGVKGSAEMESKAEKETHSKMVFHIEF